MGTVVCTEESEFDVDSVCIPHKGAMTYFTTCDSCPEEPAILLGAIKAGCENDIYIDGDMIKKVHFIGEREQIPFVVSTVSNEEKEPELVSEPPLNIMGGVFIFLVVAAVLAIAAAMQLTFKKKRNNRDDNSYNDSELDSNESVVSEDALV